MHEGIGRAGYRMLAAVFLAVGLLGAALAWYGTTQPGTIMTVLGILLAGVALALLFILAIVLPSASAPPKAAAAPAVAAPQRSPRAPEDRERGAGSLDFDFDDSMPAPRAAPEELVVPPAFQPGAPPAPTGAALPPAPVHEAPEPVVAPVQFNERDAAAWPGSRGLSSWTTERKARQQASQRAEERRPRQVFTQRYTQRAPMVRQILSEQGGAGPQAPRMGAASPAPSMAPGAPVAQTRQPARANQASVPEGKSRGKCGQCGTILLAPNRRPLSLKCPVCQKVSRLE